MSTIEELTEGVSAKCSARSGVILVSFARSDMQQQTCPPRWLQWPLETGPLETINLETEALETGNEGLWQQLGGVSAAYELAQQVPTGKTRLQEIAAKAVRRMMRPML